jgi:hypothetical protein
MYGFECKWHQTRRNECYKYKMTRNGENISTAPQVAKRESNDRELTFFIHLHFDPSSIFDFS